MYLRKYFIRFIFAAIIFAILFSVVDTAELLEVIKNTDLFYFILLVLFSIVLIWASCLKWQLFVRASGNRVRISKLMNLYTIGYFFNSFMPSYIGGDIVRSYKLGTHISGKLDAFIATFMERFTGLIAMVFLALVFVTVGSPATAGVEYAVIIVAAGTLIFSLICFSKSGSLLIRKLVQFSARILFKEKTTNLILSRFERVREGVLALGSHSGLFFVALVYSFGFHVLTVINTYLACRAIGVDSPSWEGLFVVVPLVLIISMAPLTPGGLGIQEGAFLFLLQRIGISPEEALSIGLILRAKLIIIALVGGLLLLTPANKTAKT